MLCKKKFNKYVSANNIITVTLASETELLAGDAAFFWRATG